VIEIRKKDRYAFNCATQRERNAFHVENLVIFPDTRRARTKRQRSLTREEIPISTHATKSPYNNTEGIFSPSSPVAHHANVMIRKISFPARWQSSREG